MIWDSERDRSVFKRPVFCCGMGISEFIGVVKDGLNHPIDDIRVHTCWSEHGILITYGVGHRALVAKAAITCRYILDKVALHLLCHIFSLFLCQPHKHTLPLGLVNLHHCTGNDGVENGINSPFDEIPCALFYVWE